MHDSYTPLCGMVALLNIMLGEIVFGGGSNFGGTTMLTNQTLLGGGGLLQVRSLATGQIYTYTAPGTRPTFQGGDPA
jgi:hypothetical protein